MAPQRRRGRASIRWDEWDYRAPGIYFVTICTRGRRRLFDDPGLRGAVESAWTALPQYPNSRPLELDAWVVMPDHLHGVITLLPKDDALSQAQGSGSLGTVVGLFKRISAQRINLLRNSPGAPVWQRGYHDRVVRDDDELQRIRTYIAENPARWRETHR